jgi:N-6 DNA Methylase
MRLDALGSAVYAPLTMDLFAASGIDLPRSGGPTRRTAAPRSLRVPLFAHKVVEEARGKAAFAPAEAQRKAAHDYARRAKKSFGRLKEEAVRPIFFSVILEQLLGYKTADPESEYSLAFERPIRRGAVDVALGRFDERAAVNDIVAPFELKGPATVDLDAPMPGRGRSPVQQAWDYAIDAPGARWVLVSNCLEIRLYGFGRGREAYEVFDLGRLDEDSEHERLWLILSANRFLGGATEQLLRDTDGAYKDITNRLYLEYKGLRDRLVSFIVDSADGPKLSSLRAIEPAQKILDRILFIAFAQRTDLLPDRLLERAAQSRNEFVPQPLWSNFAALFHAVDRGDTRLQVWPYNGGLFAADPVVDDIVLPDDLAAEVAELGKWDYRSEVPVTLLGHIFEQSITDIERLKAEGRGEAPPKISQRKRTGVVYTPDMVTRFLVEKTIGVTLREYFDEAWMRFGMGEGASEDAQRAFWRADLARLRGLTVVDPACGSGAFLVAAFDALASEYRRGEKALKALGEPIAFDIFDEIVTHNLYGVDLNPESAEITRLSLWLKTARRDHRLQNLEATIRVGDSLIEDGAYTARPFEWRAAFPHVFERGGFDIVIGNPPYVRMEYIKPIKPYLEEHYAVAADRADLYAYFYERAVGLSKEGGRLGFISSSTFFRTGSGEPLRRFLSERTAIETIVDFGDAQLFEGVTTYPAILTLRKAPEQNGDVAYLVIEGEAPTDLGRAFREGARTMGRARLSATTWRVEDDELAKLRNKIANGRKTLSEVYGAPLRGIVTGLNEPFIIDTPTRDRLLRADPKSAELLRPFLRGENVKRWRVEPEGLWLINTPKGKVDIDAYPAIRDWLLPFKPELEKRAAKQKWFVTPTELLSTSTRKNVVEVSKAFVIDTPTRDWLVKADPKSAELLERLHVEGEGQWLIDTRKGNVDIEGYPAVRDWLLPFKPELEKHATRQEWFELQQAQLAYQPKFQELKIVYPVISQGPKYSVDFEGRYINDKCFTIISSYDLVSLLNSKLLWFWLFGEASPLRGGQWRLELREQYVSRLPIPDMPPDSRTRLAALGQACTHAAHERFEIQAAVRRRILDLASGDRRKLTGKLYGWHELDFAAFRAEIKRAFRVDVPVKERGEWETYLRENTAHVRDLSDRIAAAEREIDQIVYALFGLTPEQIALLEASLKGQY